MTRTLEVQCQLPLWVTQGLALCRPMESTAQNLPTHCCLATVLMLTLTLESLGILQSDCCNGPGLKAGCPLRTKLCDSGPFTGSILGGNVLLVVSV